MTTKNQKRLTAELRRLLLGRPQHRRVGKIARLPLATREHINRMIEDGLPYRAILEKLSQSSTAPLPYPISEDNLSTWRLGGFQEWRREQQQKEFLARSRTATLRQEPDPAPIGAVPQLSEASKA